MSTPKCATVRFDDGEELHFDDRVSFVVFLNNLPAFGKRRPFTWINHETGNAFRVSPKEDEEPGSFMGDGT